MRLTPLLAAAAALGLASAARALEVTQTATAAAPPAKVWATIRDFDGIATWLPPAKSSPADHGNARGSVRVITLRAPGDPTVTEKLLKFEPSRRSYTYAIVKVDPKVLPVTGYTSTISVAAQGSGSLITWHGNFEPAAGVDADTATKAVTGVYRAGLDNLAKQ